MSIHRVVPDLTSARLEVSRDFYVGVLGFEVAMDMGWIVTLISPANPTVQISLMRKDEAASVTPSVTVEVSDVDAIYAEVVRRDLQVVYPLTDEAWEVQRFFVSDPNGFVLNVMSHPGR